MIFRYHDDPNLLKRGAAAAAYGFDPHRAERTRAKMPKTYSNEEREWSTIDRILHPEIWKFYVNHDSNVGADRKSKESAQKGEGGAGGGNEAGQGMNKGGDGDKDKKTVSEGKKKTAGAMGAILGMGKEFAAATGMFRYRYRYRYRYMYRYMYRYRYRYMHGSGLGLGIMWSAALDRQIWCPPIILYNITSIAYNHPAY